MNTTTQFRLQWRNHSPNFVSVFTQLLNSESLVDVTLSADGKQIQAHRVVLSACSNYFQELFVSHPCQHPIVILKDVKYKDLCTIIHFMYHGEVNITQEQIDSILKTAEALQVKGFADVVDAESFTAALMTHKSAPSLEQSHEGAEAAPSRRKRQRYSSSSSHSRSSVNPPLLNANCHEFSEEKSSSLQSISSSETGSVIKDKPSIREQTSTESGTGSFSKEDADEDQTGANGKSNSSWSTSNRTNGSTSLDIPSDSGTQSSKTKRNRFLIRQQCVKKDNELHGVPSDGDIHSPSNLQPILPKSPAPSLNDADNSTNKPCTQTFLQLPPTPHLPRQHSQPILPSQSSCVPTSSSSSANTMSGTGNLPPISFLPANIPTLAVTPVNSSSNIVLDPFPIFRVVSVEEMSPGLQSGSNPVLTRASSCHQVASSSNTLQVPSMDEGGSPQGLHRLKTKLEENLRRTVSNPGISPSPSGSGSSRSGHCPELRTGAALGCNYCWNTVDNHGRILRRKTKYFCPDCQANLCIVPCFQEYHEKFPSTESNNGPGSSKGSASSHQSLSKMSSI